MSRRIADLLVHFMPANLNKYSVPNAGADALAAKRLLETVAWDYDTHTELSQSCIHDMWRAFTEVAQQPEDWRYFAQRGCSSCVSRTTPANCEQLLAGSLYHCPRAWLSWGSLLVAFLTRTHTHAFLVSNVTCDCSNLQYSLPTAPPSPAPPPPFTLCVASLLCILADW